MEENENKKPEPTWEDAEGWIGAILRAHDSGTMASETIRDLEKQSKSKDLGMWLITISLGGIIAGLIVANMAHTKTFYQNDSEWRKTVQEINAKWVDYLSQYDFVSQDGEGINNINTGEQGDLNNGPKGKDSEEPGQSQRDSSKETAGQQAKQSEETDQQ